MEATKVGKHWEVTYKGKLYARLEKKPTVKELKAGGAHIEKMKARLGAAKLHPSNR